MTAADGSLYLVEHDSVHMLVKVWRQGKWVQLFPEATSVWTGREDYYPDVLSCAAAGRDGMVWVGIGDSIIRLKNGRIIGTLGKFGFVFKMEATSSNVLWTADLHGEVKRWEGPTCTHILQVRESIADIAAASDGSTLWVSTKFDQYGPWHITEWRDGSEVWRLPVQQTADHLAVGPDGTLWLASSQSSQVRGWRDQKSITLDTLGPVCSLAVGQGGSVCAMGDLYGLETKFIMEWKEDSPGGVWRLVGQRREPLLSVCRPRCAFSGDGMLWVTDPESFRVTGWS